MIEENVTRFEVIDHTTNGKGRLQPYYNVDVELSYQDDGKTLKVFLTNKNKNETTK